MQVMGQRAGGKGLFVFQMRSIKKRVKKEIWPMPLSFPFCHVLKKTCQQSGVNAEISVSVVGSVKKGIGPATLFRSMVQVMFYDNRPVPGSRRVCLSIVNCVKEGTKRIDCQLICLFQAVGEGCLPFLEREREEFFIESLVKKRADCWMFLPVA